MPFKVDPDQVKKIASIIKSRCKKADHEISLSGSRDIAARMHGYLGWNHFLKRQGTTSAANVDWDAIKTSFKKTLVEEAIPSASVDEILSVLEDHFRSLQRTSTSDDDPHNLRPMFQELDRLYRDKDFDGLHAIIVDIPPSIFGSFAPSFFAMVDEIVHRHPAAALTLAHVVPASGSAEIDLQAKLARLRLALGAEDRDPHIHLAMALLLISERKPEAMNHIGKALAAKCPDAFYGAGIAYETGMGQPPNLRMAMQYYQEGFEDHEDSKCMLRFARLLLLENDLDPEDYDYDAVQLLDELSEEDSEEGYEAAMMLETLREAKSLPRMLPETVTPQGSKRPKLIRDAIKSHFQISLQRAEAITAALHGFESWGRLLNASNDARTVKGPFDEDCDAPAFIARKKALVGVLRMYTDLDQYLAEIAISLLKPTARDGRPSLKKLEKKASNRLFPFPDDVLEEGTRDLMEKVGFEGSTSDFFTFLRSTKPIDPEVWCEYLRDTCNWDIQEIKPSPARSGSKVAVVKGEGRQFDVYMLSAAYEPGDKTDLLVDRSMKDIDQTGKDAVLLFSRVVVFGSERSDLGVLYCGRIRLDNRWSDFTVRPAAGIQGAIDQIGQFQYPPREEFISRFGFSGYLDAGAWIEANSAEGPDGPINFAMIRMASGWASYIRS